MTLLSLATHFIFQNIVLDEIKTSSGKFNVMLKTPISKFKDLATHFDVTDSALEGMDHQNMSTDINETMQISVASAKVLEIYNLS